MLAAEEDTARTFMDSLTAAQRKLLQAVLDEYVENLPAELAEQRRERVRQAGTNLHFAWAGVLEKGGPHYYRVQSPTFPIEYDNTQDKANHIHSVWRDFEDDFGVDLLRDAILLPSRSIQTYMRVLTGFLTLSLCASAQTLTWQIDSAHSAAQFAVRHMMVSTVRGDFGKLSGKAVLDLKDPANGSSVEITIDATTINTRETARDTHLKSVDFFDVAKFPTLTFKSKKVDAAGPGKLKLTGDLTLHGVTKEVVFDVEGPSPELKDARGSRIGASASTKINRKDFGLMWNRAIEAGGVVVGDEVTVTVDVELVRK